MRTSLTSADFTFEELAPKLARVQKAMEIGLCPGWYGDVDKLFAVKKLLFPQGPHTQTIACIQKDTSVIGVGPSFWCNYVPGFNEFFTGVIGGLIRAYGPNWASSSSMDYRTQEL